MPDGIWDFVRTGASRLVQGGGRMVGSLFGRAVEVVQEHPRALIGTAAAVAATMAGRSLYQWFTTAARNIGQVGRTNPELARLLTERSNHAETSRSNMNWLSGVALLDPSLHDPGNGALPDPISEAPRLQVTFPPEKAREYQDFVESFQGIFGFVFPEDLETLRVDIAYSGNQLLQMGCDPIDPHALQPLLAAAIPPEISDHLPLQDRLNQAFMPRDEMRGLQGRRLAILSDTYALSERFSYREFDQEFGDPRLDHLAGSLGEAQDADEQIHALLENSKGFVIGEGHGEGGAKKYLVDHMQALADNGVTTLFLEHVWTDFQPLLDEWFALRNPDEPGVVPPMPFALAQAVDYSDLNHGLENPNSLRGVLEAAFRANIRPVGFDAYEVQSGAPGPTGAQIRIGAMNLKAAEAVKNRQDEDKFVLLVGSDHSNTRPGLHAGIPGLSQMLHIPAVQSTDGQRVALDREDKSNRRA